MTAGSGGGDSPSVVFCGTPAAAVPALEKVASEMAVALVVTRPDRPRGRGRQPQPPPIREAAERLGLTVAQPSGRGDLLDLLASEEFDLGIVVAFGVILPASVLELAPRGFLNLHFSLLPRWRGAAPVEHAILAGDSETGVSVMLIEEGLDTGPVLATATTPIGPEENAGALRERLARQGADLLAETARRWWLGELEPRPQDETGATYAPPIRAADRDLSTLLGPVDFERRVRAMAPQPGARLEVAGVPHKILDAAVGRARLDPGEWAAVEGWPVLGVTGGSVTVRKIQPPGGNPMAGDAWLRGHDLPR